MTTNVQRSDVLVIGGGLVGAVAARALSHAGLSVTVIDGEDPKTVTQAGFDGRASAIAAASKRLLRALDIWPHLAAQAALAAVAADANIQFVAPNRVETLERDRSGVRAVLSDGSEVVASLAIAADGRGSGVRKDAGIRVTGWRYPQEAIVCTVEHEHPHAFVVERHGGEARLPVFHRLDGACGTCPHHGQLG